jgi:hypothetical protein
MQSLQVYGASCGALSAVFLKTNVDVHRATQLAFDLSIKHGVFKRRTGLVGVWGPIIETWLYELLPDNAHDMCNGSVHIQVLTERGQATTISKFESREFLVQVLLASTHIPLVLDGKLFRSVEGKRYLDGFIFGDLPGEEASLVCSFPDHVSRLPIAKMLDLETARAHVELGMNTLPSTVFLAMHQFPMKKNTMFSCCFRALLFLTNVVLFICMILASLYNRSKAGSSASVRPCSTALSDTTGIGASALSNLSALADGVPPNELSESSLVSSDLNTSQHLSTFREEPHKISPGLRVWVVDRTNKAEGLQICEGFVQSASMRTAHICNDTYWRLSFDSDSYCSDYPESQIYLSRHQASRILTDVLASGEHTRETNEGSVATSVAFNTLPPQLRFPLPSLPLRSSSNGAKRRINAPNSESGRSKR